MPHSPSAETLLAQALPLHRAGQVGQAQALYRQALMLEPNHAEANHLLGVTLLQTGQAEAAHAALDRAVALAPGHARAHNNLGAACRALGLLENAAGHFAAAARLEPGFAEALHNQAATLLQLGRAAEALPVLERLLVLAPGDLAAQGQHGLALLACGRAEAALAPLAQALARMPDNTLLLRGQAEAFLALDRPAEALAPLERALALLPGEAEAHASLGLALEQLGRFAAARAAFDAALERAPDPETLANRGVVREELLDLAGAEADFRAALALAPEDAEAAFFLGLARLRAGDWEAGWAGYEARRRIARADPRLARAGQAWDGKASLKGRTLLLHDEQGMGDAIQFCRYAPLLAARGARLVLEVAPPLVPLLRSLEGVAQVLPAGQPVPRHDMHCALLSLPHLLGGPIPARVPYLAAPPERAAAWAAELPPGGLRIALVASGNPRHSRDARRSLPLAALAGALRKPSRRLVLAQREIRAEDAAWLAAEGADVLAPLGRLTDFAETAALLACCDLVVSVDTSVAHLAGALGRPCWVLLPALADFRWLTGRRDSPWYPTARLFRQDAPGDWAGVLRQLEQEALQIG